jgi:hypothetical protein
MAFSLNPAAGIAAGTAAIAGMGLLIQQLNKQSASIGGSITGAKTQEDYNALAGVRTPFVGGASPAAKGVGISTGGATTTPTATGSTIKTNAPAVAPAPVLTPSGNAIPSTFDVAAARRGEMEQPPIVINVQAPSVIDETGFTRAVQLAIQNTQQRGTGGAGFAQIL